MTETINGFICRKRCLLAQLPELNHAEMIQIDLVYGMLGPDIRQDVPRDNVDSIENLLQKSRLKEQTLLGKASNSQICEKIKETKRCSYCQARATTRNNTAEETKFVPPTVSCYGCKAPDVYLVLHVLRKKIFTEHKQDWMKMFRW